MVEKSGGGGQNQEVVFVFWTGGWDSTYRIVELSMKEVIISPVYVIDQDRPSSYLEMETMDRISSVLRKCENTKAIILPVKKIEKEHIKDHIEITKAYKTISSHIKLGNQYDWLARLAMDYPEIEVSIEKPNGEYGGCSAAIERFGELKREKDTFKIQKNKSSKELCLLFENMSFPIINITEREMVNNIKKWGYENVMKLIWFCHAPIKRETCGFCRPCEQKMECGMDFLLSEKGKRRYKVFRILKSILGNKLGRKLMILGTRLVYLRS